MGLEAGELDAAELQGLARLAAELSGGALTLAEAREAFPGS